MSRTNIETIICLSPNFLYVYVFILLAELPSTVLRGIEECSDPSYIFSGGGVRTPNPMINAPGTYYEVLIYTLSNTV